MSGELGRRQLVLAVIAAVALFGAALYLVLGSDSNESQPSVTEVGDVSASSVPPGASSSTDPAADASPAERGPSTDAGTKNTEAGKQDTGAGKQSADEAELSEAPPPAGEAACSGSGCGPAKETSGPHRRDADDRAVAQRGAEPRVTEAAAPADIDERGSDDRGTSRQAIRQSEAVESRNGPIDEEALASPEAIDESTEAETSGQGGHGNGGH